MITMTPVLEGAPQGCPFWAVGQRGGLYLPVPGRPVPEQVGAVVWALIRDTVTADDLSITATSRADAIAAYLAADDAHFAPGGLRVASGDVVIEPGCCVGLDEWRDWLSVLDGQEIFLGHSPDVVLEDRGPILRLRQVSAEPSIPADVSIDLPRDVLVDLLQVVHHDLLGFLAAVDPWAQGIGTGLADPLTAAVDRCLQITAPGDC